MPVDKYTLERRGELLVGALSTFAILASEVDQLPNPADLSATLALLRDHAERFYNDTMELLFPDSP